jgi:hypothetical protein
MAVPCCRKKTTPLSDAIVGSRKTPSREEETRQMLQVPTFPDSLHHAHDIHLLCTECGLDVLEKMVIRTAIARIIIFLLPERAE